jgi:serpin B
MIFLKRVICCLSLLVLGSVSGETEENGGYEKPRPIPAVEANNQFACDLYKEIKQRGGNLFFSPYSITNAMTMTYGGAEGQTKDEIEKLFHIAGERTDFVQSVKFLNQELTEPEIGLEFPNPITLRSANSLWVQKEFFLTPMYLDQMTKELEAFVNSVDFIGDSDGSRNEINQWVEGRTDGKITDLLADGDVTRDTRLVLVSALHMKGAWQRPFLPEETTIAPFYLDADLEPTPLTVMPPSVDVSIMSDTGFYYFFKGDQFSMLELPFESNHSGKRELSLYILLPDDVRGLLDLEKELTGENLAGWMENVEMQYVRVEIPKFEAAETLELNEVFQQMGMKEAFSENADFSGMTGAKDLSISKVVQKSFISVDEKGAEAAASTAVSLELTSMQIPEELQYFRADRSFIYMIADRNTGAILFMGRMAQP